MCNSRECSSRTAEDDEFGYDPFADPLSFENVFGAGDTDTAPGPTVEAGGTAPEPTSEADPEPMAEKPNAKRRGDRKARTRNIGPTGASTSTSSGAVPKVEAATPKMEPHRGREALLDDVPLQVKRYRR